VGVQEVKWDGSGNEPAGVYTFFYGKRNENHELGTGVLCERELCQQAKGVVYVSDRMSHNRKWSLISYHCSEGSCPNRE
jgi:hypothetical protein